MAGFKGQQGGGELGPEIVVEFTTHPAAFLLLDQEQAPQEPAAFGLAGLEPLVELGVLDPKPHHPGQGLEEGVVHGLGEVLAGEGVDRPGSVCSWNRQGDERGCP